MFDNIVERINNNLKSWEDGLADPVSSQKMVLAKLIQGYSKTDYGNIFNVRSISDIDDYRQKIPIVRYSDLENWFKRVRDEHWSVFLNEEPITWVMKIGRASCRERV